MIDAEVIEWSPLGQCVTVLSGGTATAVVLLKKKAMDVGSLGSAGRASIYPKPRFKIRDRSSSQFMNDFETVLK